jgi:hypothetical protein
LELCTFWARNGHVLCIILKGSSHLPWGYLSNVHHQDVCSPRQRLTHLFRAVRGKKDADTTSVLPAIKAKPDLLSSLIWPWIEHPARFAQGIPDCGSKSRPVLDGSPVFVRTIDSGFWGRFWEPPRFFFLKFTILRITPVFRIQKHFRLGDFQG